MDAKTLSSSSATPKAASGAPITGAEFRLDGLTDSDLRQIAEWRNAQREVLRTPGFTHAALQRDWLIEMRKQGGLVAAIRQRDATEYQGRIALCGYVALYPVHGDYAELGWLHGGGVNDGDCIRLALDYARACGLHFLIAETCRKSNLSAVRTRAEALEYAEFKFTVPTAPSDNWRTFWVRAL